MFLVSYKSSEKYHSRVKYKYDLDRGLQRAHGGKERSHVKAIELSMGFLKFCFCFCFLNNKETYVLWKTVFIFFHCLYLIPILLNRVAFYCDSSHIYVKVRWSFQHELSNNGIQSSNFTTWQVDTKEQNMQN